IEFDLQGQAGPGLLPGNEVPAVSAAGTGTGGELGSNITYDPATMILTLNFGWGSANGFTDLSGTATAAHLHGATNGSQTISSNVLQGFSGFDTAADSGSVMATLTLNATEAAIVLDGRSYLNVHTSANGGGEIRGNLVRVSSIPEPSSSALLAIVGLAGMARRRR
ncbi:CHRD domain-containing protein, partial [bacterium]|nr:CHRD domain-containing protein [bacterium]